MQLHKNSHTAVQLVLVHVVPSFIVWLAGMEWNQHAPENDARHTSDLPMRVIVPYYLVGRNR
jgi:hypothetical protein